MAIVRRNAITEEPVHIALIAMSGVRAANPELNEVGLTMPGFVERSKVIASLPSLSLLTLAGMTPDAFEVSYHEIADLRLLDSIPDCDVAAIASFSAQIKDAYELSDRYRQQGVRTVLGGLHVTARPREAARHADAIVIGEGELGWPSLLDDLMAGHLQAGLRGGGARVRASPTHRCRGSTSSTSIGTTASPCKLSVAVRGAATSARPRSA